MATKIKSIVSGLIIIIVICGFLFFGLKGCIVVTWAPPQEPASYVIKGKDDRLLRLIFMPEGTTLLWYKDPAKNSTEAGLLRMRGTYGTHYIGPFWKIPRPGIIPGFRIYPSGAKPVLMEVKVLQKYKTGLGDSQFPDEGDTRSIVILFRSEGGEHSIRFEKMWLEREAVDFKFVDRVLALLGP